MSKFAKLFTLAALAAALLSVPAAKAYEGAPGQPGFAPGPPLAASSPLAPLSRDLSDILYRLKLSPAQEGLWEQAEVARSALTTTGAYKQRKQQEYTRTLLAEGKVPVGEIVRRAGQEQLDEIKRQVEVENLWLTFLDSLDEGQGSLVRGLMLERMEMADNMRRLAVTAPRPTPEARPPMPPFGAEGGRGRPMMR